MFLVLGPWTLGVSKDGIMGKGFETVLNMVPKYAVSVSVLTSPRIFGSTRDGWKIKQHHPRELQTRLAGASPP